MAASPKRRVGLRAAASSLPGLLVDTIPNQDETQGLLQSFRQWGGGVSGSAEGAAGDLSI